MRAIPTRAATFVARHEGLRLESYRDPAGVWTVGYGHTGAEVHGGLRITKAQADALLAEDLETAASRLASLLKPAVIEGLTENQYAALLSFTFNLGVDPRWTIWKRLNAGQYDQVPVELVRFVHARGRKLQGLVDRRSAEIALWSRDEPGSVDERPPSSLTREEPTPPMPLKAATPGGARALVSTASAGVATAAVAVGEVSRAISPYAQQSAVVGRVVATLALIAAVLAGVGVFFVWLRKTEALR